MSGHALLTCQRFACTLLAWPAHWEVCYMANLLCAGHGLEVLWVSQVPP